MPAAKVYVLEAYGTTVLAGTSERIFRSRDSGKTWEPFSEGMFSLVEAGVADDMDKAVVAISVGNQYLTLGTIRGTVWTRPVGDVLPLAGAFGRTGRANRYEVRFEKGRMLIGTREGRPLGSGQDVRLTSPEKGRRSGQNETQTRGGGARRSSVNLTGKTVFCIRGAAPGRPRMRPTSWRPSPDAPGAGPTRPRTGKRPQWSSTFRLRPR